MDTITALWGVGLGLLLVATVALRAWRSFRLERAWRRVAATCGLTWVGTQLSDAPGRIEGTFEGFEVDLRCVQAGSEGARPTMTRASVVLPQRLPTWVQLRPRRLLMITEEAADAPVVQTGDADFDARFELRSPRPEAALTLFGPRVRAQLMPLVEWGGTWRWEDRRLAWQALGLLGDEARLQRTIAAQARLARAVSASLMGERAQALGQDAEASAERAAGARVGLRRGG